MFNEHKTSSRPNRLNAKNKMWSKVKWVLYNEILKQSKIHVLNIEISKQSRQCVSNTCLVYPKYLIIRQYIASNLMKNYTT